MVNNRIIVMGGDNYNTCDIVRSLGENDYDFTTIIVGTMGGMNFTCNSKYLKNRKYTLVRGYNEALKELKRYITDSNDKAFLIVEGDGLTGFLDMHFNELYPFFIWNNAGEEGRLSYYLDKYNQIEVAKNCGIKTIDSVVMSRGDTNIGIDYPIITKAISSTITNWKSESFVCNNEEELMDAYSNIKSDKVLVQRLIKKKDEYVYDGFSIDGGRQQFIAIFSHYTYLLPDQYAKRAWVENFNNPDIENQITKFMSYIHYEGIYEFEFIVDEDDNMYFMENNFRNSGWSYASTCVGMPLPVLWMESMLHGSITESNRRHIKEGFTFIEDVNDFDERVRGNMLPFRRWLKEYIDTDCKLYLGRNDSKPLIKYVIWRLRNKIIRTIKNQPKERKIMQ